MLLSNENRHGTVSLVRLICAPLLFWMTTVLSTVSTAADGKSGGGFSLEVVENLALYFATESTRRLHIPLAMKIFMIATDEPTRQEEIDKIRANPPKANERGVVYPFGKHNPLSLTYNENRRTMTVWERFVKKRGRIGYYGLTGVELAAALNEATSREDERAGTDFAYDPVADAVSLHREYQRPPEDLDRFYEEVNGMVKAQLHWLESERFIEVAKAAVKRHAPPVTASAENDGFRASLVLRHFSVYPVLTQFYVARYVKTWNRRHGAPSPLLVSDDRVYTGQNLNGFIHFQGATSGDDGSGAVNATFRLLYPNGTPVFENHQVEIWRTPSPPADHLQLGLNNLVVPFGAGTPLGSYKLEAKVCDEVAGRCVSLTHPFELTSS